MTQRVAFAPQNALNRLDLAVRAALRIKAELERCAPNQMIWVLTPGVELCRQQHNTLSAFLPSVRTRLLIGEDNMDRWGEKRIWDAALDQVRIVVSTHAVLAQALGHAYVSLSRLALLVFDEAHHCIKNHPANVIMRDYYHREKQSIKAKKGGSELTCALPHILGLSASLVMKSNVRMLRVIEENMDCVSITPRVHRDELIKCVNRPTCVLLEFLDNSSNNQNSYKTALQRLTQVYQTSSLADRLSAIELQQETTINPDSLREHLEQLWKKAVHVHEILGPWSAELLIVQTVDLLKHDIAERTKMLWDMADKVKRSILRELNIPALDRFYQAGLELDFFSPSSKAECLISFLDQQPVGTTGVVFVERRVVAATLSQLLSKHPKTRDKFRSAAFVGSSSSQSRTASFGEILNVKAQPDVLEKFRRGEINLLVATSALEEGIDVQSCNLVVCFDPPANMKSFIQRRGRARQERSTMAIMASSGDEQFKIHQWRALEAEMVRICQSDREDPNVDFVEDEEDVVFRLTHPRTQAMITGDSALAHLYHFCDTLPPQPYVDHRPIFAYEADLDDMIQATVTLPSCLSTSVRCFSSSRSWTSEKAARKDAAFQAYKALYVFGLLNDHLLPLCQSWGPAADFIELQHSVVKIRKQLNVWNNEDQPTTYAQPQYEANICIVNEVDNSEVLRLSMVTFEQIPGVAPLRLPWAKDQTFVIEISASKVLDAQPSEKLEVLRDATIAIFECSRSQRRSLTESDLAVFLQPTQDEDALAWLERNRGTIPAEEYYTNREITEDKIVRVPYCNRPPFVFQGWTFNEENRLSILCRPLRRQRDLIRSSESHKLDTKPTGRTESKQTTFPAAHCQIDRMGFRFVQFSLFLPRVLGHISDAMIGLALRDKILPGITYRDIEHTITAIRTPAAGRETNYQQYEFVGDAVLKFVVTRFLFASHPAWPEGFLSKRRVHLVCNERLASEALRLGLDQFVITERITHRSWSLPTRLQEATDREISSKLLADVVEALIGATFVDTNGDLEQSRACISRFIPAIPLLDPSIPSRLLPSKCSDAAFISEAERVIGRAFKQKVLLVESLTHSAGGSPIQTETYQRLEFLGDAVLDLIVVTQLLQHERSTSKLSQGKLTNLRAALVNSHLLGYFNISFQIHRESSTVQTDRETGHFRVTTIDSPLSLWCCLRHDSPDIAAAQQTCLKRYQELSAGLQDALKYGGSYPWETLLQLYPPKFFSDAIESVIGAIFVDSGLQLRPCEEFLTRIGFTAYLNRLVREDVDVTHPKDRLSRLLGPHKAVYEVEKEAENRFGGKLRIEDIVRAEVHWSASKELASAKLARLGTEGLLAEQLPDHGQDCAG